MPLPFDDDKNKRRYQCFVCGLQFSEFTDYNNHIVEKHEEGREYLRCPLEHCQAAVRDLRAHFKCKHPRIPMPEKGMTKAVVWKDFNAKGTRAKTQKPKFREGWYESTKMGKSMHYRSGYEAKVYEYLDADNEVLTFEVEPFEIEYVHKGRSHKYVPDVIVRFINGKTELWEIKPANQTLLEKNEDKWHAAKRACDTRGWEFVVITEVGIDRLKAKVKQQAAEFRANSQ
jgi:hypothetical protein